MAERWQHELRKLNLLEPPAGLWDRAVAGPRREPWQPRASWRSVAPIAAALAIVLVAGTFGLVRALDTVSGGAGWTRQHADRVIDRQFDWSIRVPAGLRADHFRSGDLRYTSDGVRVTNFAPDLSARSSGTPPTGWLRHFPARGVAVQIWTLQGPPGGPPPPRDNTFPLSRSLFRRGPPYAGGTEPRPWYRDFYANAIGFSAAVWIGPRASRTAEHAAWAVVRSLRFGLLKEGTVWRRSFYVLGPASRYPIGSVATFRPSALPRHPGGLAEHVPAGFFLIHAPRAFYVIHRQFQSQSKPYNTCTLGFDRKTFQFYCPGTRLRWNRVGQPVGAGTKRRLGLVPATVAQGGRVLFSPFWGDVLRVHLRASPWR